MDQFKFRYKKTARNLSIGKGFSALTSNDKTRSTKLKYISISLLLKNKIITSLNQQERDKNQRIATIAYLRYLKLVGDFDDQNFGNKKHKKHYFDRGIDSFTPSQCWNFFETRKEDLYRLFRGLRIPNAPLSSNKCLQRQLV